MDVTFLANNYWPSVGGAQTHVQRVAEGLAGRFGHRVTVLTTDALFPPAGPEPGRIESAHEDIGGVHVERFPVARRTHSALRTLRRLGRRTGLHHPRSDSALAIGPLGLKLLTAARRAGRTSDVLIGVTCPYLTVFGADVATRRRPAAFAVMPLLHISEAPPRPWALRALRRADGCTASTTFERDWLVDHGVDPERISILPPGCDPDRQADIDASTARGVLGLPDRPTVGYIGRLSPLKGVDTFLAAAPALWERFPDLTVLVAGGRTSWTGFDSLVQNLEGVANGRLVVLDGFSERDKPTLFAACDAIAFPSREESFGIVTLEAWSARRPVVVADIPAVRSVVRDGEDAMVVPVGDAEALADRLGELLSDPSVGTRLGLAGRSRAEAEFRWDDIVEGWNGFLQRAVRHRASHGVGD